MYYCGPTPLMDAVRDMTGHWPPGTVHFESFGAGAKAFANNQAFSVKLHKTNAKIEVSATQTLLEALREGGHQVSSSCESGTCGSCKTSWLAGDVEHRDMVLSDEEKLRHIMVCVSRARGGELVLDL